MFAGPIVTRLTAGNQALTEAFQLLGLMVVSDPFYFESLREWAMVVVRILHDNEAIRTGKMGELVARDGIEYRREKAGREAVKLIDGYAHMVDVTGTLDTIYQAGYQAASSVASALRKIQKEG